MLCINITFHFIYLFSLVFDIISNNANAMTFHGYGRLFLWMFDVS